MRKIFLILVLCLSLAASCFGADYYFAPTGNDTTGDGSQSSPWLNPKNHTTTSSDNLYLSREFDDCTHPVPAFSFTQAMANLYAYGSYGSTGPVVDCSTYAIVSCAGLIRGIIFKGSDGNSQQVAASSGATFTTCVFSHCKLRGGPYSVYYCTGYYDNATYGAFDSYNDGGSDSTLYSSAFWNPSGDDVYYAGGTHHDITINYCGFEDANSSGWGFTTVTDTSSTFGIADMGFADIDNCDCHISSTSPLIDIASTNTTSDLDGESRCYDGDLDGADGCDVGADEFHYDAAVDVTTNDQVIKWAVYQGSNKADSYGILIHPGVTGTKLYNLTLSDYDTGIAAYADVTIKNCAVVNMTTADLYIDAGDTVTGDYNYFEDSNREGLGTYLDGGHTNWDRDDAMFIDESVGNFNLSGQNILAYGGVLNVGDPYSDTEYDVNGLRVTQSDGTEYYLSVHPIGGCISIPLSHNKSMLKPGMSLGGRGLITAP